MSSAPVAAASAERVRMFPTPVSAAQRARRQHQRFPIAAAAEYILSGSRVQTTTRNISSGGVLLNTATVLPIGKLIQVWIDWPVLLDERCRLRLVINGRVLRSDWDGTAVTITKYEFRIRADVPRAAASRQEVLRRREDLVLL